MTFSNCFTYLKKKGLYELSLQLYYFFHVEEAAVPVVIAVISS